MEKKQLFISKLRQDQHNIGIKQIKSIEQLTAQYSQETQPLQGETKLIPTDHQEYADDAILTLEPTNTQEITKPLRNYQTVTEGRQIPIQWRKNRNTNHGQNPKYENLLETPFGKIEFKTKGKY